MNLILIKHAMPTIDTLVAPPAWELSDEGREATKRLADELSDRRIASIVSSREPKAAGTAKVLAAQLEMPWSIAEGLHEHVRGPMPWRGQDKWHALLRRFFDNPDELVFGEETATQARERFTSAIESVCLEVDPAAGALCIVCHGTVISLFAARYLGVTPYSLWERLKLPDYVELEYSSAT